MDGGETARPTHPIPHPLAPHPLSSGSRLPTLQPPPPQDSQEKRELGVAAKPKITPCCQDLPQHGSFSCFHAQLSPEPDPRSSLAGDRDGWQSWSRGPPSVTVYPLQLSAAPSPRGRDTSCGSQAKENNSIHHGNDLSTYCILQRWGLLPLFYKEGN